MTARSFIADRMGPVLAPVLLQRHRIRRPADLARLDLLHAETRPGALSRWLTIMGANGADADVDAVVDAGRGLRFEHTYFLLEAAVSGLGAAIGSHPLVEQDLKSGRLIAPFGFVPSGSAYHLLSPRMDPSRARIAAFTKWLMPEGA